MLRIWTKTTVTGRKNANSKDKLLLETMFGHCYTLHTRMSRETHRERNEGPAVRCLPTLQVSSDIVGSSKSCLELYNYTTLAKKTPVTPSVTPLVNTVECCVHLQPGNEALFTTCLCPWSLFRLHGIWEVGTFWVNPNPTTNRPCQENQRPVCMWPYNVAPSTHPVLSSAYIYLTLSLFFHFHFQKS